MYIFIQKKKYIYERDVSISGGCAKRRLHSGWSVLCFLVLPHRHLVLPSHEGTTVQQLWSMLLLVFEKFAHTPFLICFSWSWESIEWEAQHLHKSFSPNWARLYRFVGVLAAMFFVIRSRHLMRCCKANQEDMQA